MTSIIWLHPPIISLLKHHHRRTKPSQSILLPFRFVLVSTLQIMFVCVYSLSKDRRRDTFWGKHEWEADTLSETGMIWLDCGVSCCTNYHINKKSSFSLVPGDSRFMPEFIFMWKAQHCMLTQVHPQTDVLIYLINNDINISAYLHIGILGGHCWDIRQLPSLLGQHTGSVVITVASQKVRP